MTFCIDKHIVGDIVLVINLGSVYMLIATDKREYPHIFFLISPRKHILWYSLEAPQRGASNEYPQHMFSWRNKKDISIFSDEKSALSVAIHAVSQRSR